MALRARPAQRPCSAPWQYLRGHSVVPGCNVVGGIFSWDVCEACAADAVPDVFRSADCHNEWSVADERLDELGVGFTDLLSSDASRVMFQMEDEGLFWRGGVGWRLISRQYASAWITC
jgi:hypothetical protein